MAYTQDDLDKLDAAIATGALKVEYADKKVEYRSLNDMLRIRDIMIQQINPDKSYFNGRKYAEYNKGLL